MTGLLLILCTQLVKFTPPAPTNNYKPVIIDYVPPPAPPEPVDDEVIAPKPINPTNVTPPNRVPFETLTDLKNGINTPGTITITTLKPGDFIKTPPKANDIFRPAQVDRKPRVLRPVTPVYPLDAQRKGIEGKVVLRFVVDENGQVKDPEVIKAEPTGVFEQAALAAIIKYRFDPAVVNDKKVKCFAVLPIGFRLN
jgi:protein TonB